MLSTRVYVLTGAATEITASSVTQDLEGLFSETLHAEAGHPAQRSVIHETRGDGRKCKTQAIAPPAGRPFTC